MNSVKKPWVMYNKELDVIKFQPPNGGDYTLMTHGEVVDMPGKFICVSARRAVACVDALKGIKTEELERLAFQKKTVSAVDGLPVTIIYAYVVNDGGEAVTPG